MLGDERAVVVLALDEGGGEFHAVPLFHRWADRITAGNARPAARIQWARIAGDRSCVPESSPLPAGLAAALFASVLFSKPSGNKLDGQFIFRFDTFGDEQLWTDILRMHEVVQSAVSPRTALAVGLKVDSSVLPPNFLSKYSLDDPATTVELLRRNAVVGIVAKVEDRNITKLGITCALCHSTVDNAVAPGVGNRLDGWPNRDLDPGRIIALSPALTPGPEGGVQLLGAGPLRRALQPGPHQRPGADPAGLWAAERATRDLHGRRADLLLEQLCRGDADGRAGQLL
jgi:hypothetical protein